MLRFYVGIIVHGKEDQQKCRQQLSHGANSIGGSNNTWGKKTRFQDLEDGKVENLPELEEKELEDEEVNQRNFTGTVG